ncbi:copper resistance CopC/CopD family protein [Phytohabitans rumicis]|uniref:Transport integral membrane protein n=1 Tax=Phytohabitans rumicis TaxID=1076125 RepID=A0A6V8KXI3_9ACTN|nr:copper resistance protein CopC [Phytohabitans rumicis]GFJ89792.1 transport integral membrane protein [Phytohabitans rumicis]
MTATPQQGAVVATAPTTIALTFNEPVRVIPGKTQVIAPNGKRINDGDPVATGTTLTIAVRTADRPLGTYVVSYRIISADSHPLTGAYTFSVGAPSETAPEVSTDNTAVAVLLSAAKYAGYVGLTFVVGPLLMLAVLWPRRQSRRGPLRLVWAGLSLLAASTVCSLWLQAPYTSGAGPFDVSPLELKQVVTSETGVALLVRLLVIAVVAALIRPALRVKARRVTRFALAGAAVVGLFTWPFAGHPAASPIPPVSAVGDVLHLASMAVWLGGLIVLVAFLLRRGGPDHRVLGIILPIWSRWATAAVCWLVLGGVLQAVIEIGGLARLFDTRYGQLLLVKAGLLIAVLAVAFFSRRLVLRSSPGGVRRLASVELGITAFILVASSALVQTTPGRSAGVEAAAAEQAVGFSTTLNSSVYSVQFEIFPVQLGEYNTLHAFVYTPEGKPVQDVAEWKVTLSLPEKGIDGLKNDVVTIDGNQGIGPLSFPYPGKWELTLTIRISDVDQATVRTTVPVP